MTESSTTGAHPVREERPKAWPMFRAVVGVGIFCALGIVAVYEWTRPFVQNNRIRALERATREVLSGATTNAAFRLNKDGVFEHAPGAVGGEDLVYAGYDDGHRLVGLAITARGMGYQDVIEILYGYSFEMEAIVGVSVLRSRETPGLGDRIATDPDFLRNFESLDVRLTPDGSKPVHPIEFVKPGDKTSRWQIDGITGATVTSRATAQMLRRSSDYWIPKVHRRAADFVFRKGTGK